MKGSFDRNRYHLRGTEPGFLSALLPALAFVLCLSISGAGYAHNCHWRQQGVAGPGWYGSDGYPCNDASSNVPQERWDSRWGAIARSPSTGHMGAAAKRTARKYTEKVALKECKAESGASDCEVSAVYANACVAYARGGGRLGTGTGASTEEAIWNALDVCNEVERSIQCQVIYTKCSLPERIW